MKIAVDFDSTLYDFLTSWLRKIEEHHGIKIHSSEVSHYNYVTDTYPDLRLADLYRDNHIYTPEDFYKEARQFLIDLNNLPFVEEVTIFSVASITAPSFASKYSFIYEHLGDLVHRVQLTNWSKWEHTHDYVLIDDNVKNITMHCANGHHGILYTHGDTHAWTKEAPQLLADNKISAIGTSYDQIIQHLKDLHAKQ